jgi:hypothetical protein
MGKNRPEGIGVVQVKATTLSLLLSKKNYIITCMVPLLFLINTYSHDMQY